ncbi:MAG: hypothetical protein WC307_01300 [Candidatus Nanoarchaeia archaeon]|jgi:hypothetical protein
MSWQNFNQSEVINLIGLYTKFVLEYTDEFNSLPEQSKDPVSILELFDEELIVYKKAGLTPENGFNNNVAFVSFLNKYFRSI